MTKRLSASGSMPSAVQATMTCAALSALAEPHEAKPPSPLCMAESVSMPRDTAAATAASPRYAASACSTMAVTSGSADAPFMAQPPPESSAARMASTHWRRTALPGR